MHFPSVLCRTAANALGQERVLCRVLCSLWMSSQGTSSLSEKQNEELPGTPEASVLHSHTLGSWSPTVAPYRGLGYRLLLRCLQPWSDMSHRRKARVSHQLLLSPILLLTLAAGEPHRASPAEGVPDADATETPPLAMESRIVFAQVGVGVGGE